MRRPGDAGAVKISTINSVYLPSAGGQTPPPCRRRRAGFPPAMISPSYCSTISRATESPTPGRDAGYQPAGRGRKRPGAGSAGSPGPSSSTRMCRWLSVVWRTETSTNSRQYLQALSRTLPITSIKSFCSPTKSDLRRDVERDIDPFALIDLVESGSRRRQAGGDRV